MALDRRIKCFIFTFILIILLCSSSAQTENTTRPEVTIPQGTIQGTIMTTRYNRSISAFLGIPFGQPPIGNLRFANPIAAGGWDGIRDGSVDAEECVQERYERKFGDEDCLYLNVYTPQFPENTSSSLLPTMVYIYGGAFLYGQGASTSVNPSYMLDKDIALVVFNYRTGPFGFLSTGDEVASGNWGLKDMVLALEWVRDNVQYFGGDPDKVTLFGNSAGSTAAHLLSIANATEGLFHRFITQSGSALGTWSHRPRAGYANLAYRLGSYVGCNNDTSETLIECLRTINASDIRDSYANFFEWRTYPVDPWGPTDEPDMEGALIVDTPLNLYDAGKIRDIPWITGITRDEGASSRALFSENEELYNELIENFNTLIPIMLSYTYQTDGGESWVEAVKSYYFHNFTIEKNELLTNLSVFVTDSHFLYPTYRALKQQFALAENPQYLYIFSYRGTYSTTYGDIGSTNDYGVSHADDMSYFFPCSMIMPPCYGIEPSETDHEMIDIMTETWANFANTGVPTTLDGTIWDPYSSEEKYLQIGNNSDVGVSVQYFTFQERMAFWDNLYTSVQTSDNSNSTRWTPSLFFVLLSTYFLLSGLR